MPSSTEKQTPGASDLTALLHRWLPPAVRAAQQAGFSQDYRGVTVTLTYSWAEGDVIVDPGTGTMIVEPFGST